jgi:hypothetical protein
MVKTYSTVIPKTRSVATPLIKSRSTTAEAEKGEMWEVGNCFFRVTIFLSSYALLLLIREEEEKGEPSEIFKAVREEIRLSSSDTL